MLYLWSIEEALIGYSCVKSVCCLVLCPGECCPSGIRLFRRSNNTLRVQWRSMSPLSNYSAQVTGSSSSHACSPAVPAQNTCDVSDITCGVVYSVVVAPVNPDGTIVQFCSSRMYSGKVHASVFFTDLQFIYLSWTSADPSDKQSTQLQCWPLCMSAMTKMAHFYIQFTVSIHILFIFVFLCPCFVTHIFLKS